MDGRFGRRLAGGWPVALVVFALQATTAGAQVFDLPPGEAPRPVVPGPTDPENPVARPVAPAPVAEPAPSPPVETTAPPAPQVPATPAAAEPAAADQANPTAPATTQATVPPADAVARSAPAAQAGPASPPPALPQGEDVVTASPVEVAPAPVAQTAPEPALRELGPVQDNGRPWLWVFFGAALALAALAGWLGWSSDRRPRRAGARRRKAERGRVTDGDALLPEEPFLDPAVAADAPGLAPLPTAPREPALTLTLEATRMSASLLNAALGYRLVVTNQSEEPLTHVIISGDMVAAHASRPAHELLGAAGPLPALHKLVVVPPGSTATVTGEMRLPLSAITPIRNGNEALFVPIARVRAEGVTPGGQRVSGAGAFVVGRPAPRERLQPFRLDLGPRLYSHLGQHQLQATA